MRKDAAVNVDTLQSTTLHCVAKQHTVRCMVPGMHRGQ